MGSQNEEELDSLKHLFYPLTTLKIIHFLVILGLLIYINSFFNGFIGDDFDQIVRNPLIHSPVNIFRFFLGGTFFNGFTTASGIYYKPLQSTIYSLLFVFSSGNAFIFHVFEVLVHIANSILLFFFLRKFFSKDASFISSLIFLAHSVNSEVVLSIASLQDVLFVFFGLLFFLMISRKIEGILKTSLVYLLLLGSLLSKETGILFLIITPLYLYLFNKKIIKKHVIYLVSTFLIYGMLRINAVGLYKTGGESFQFLHMSLLERLMHLPAILFQDFILFIFPYHLSFAQNWIIKNISFYNFYLPLIIVCIVFGSSVNFGLKYFSDKKTKSLYFFLTWFFLGLFFHSQIIPLDVTFAERWLYFSMIGFAGLIANSLNKYELYSKKNILVTIIILIFIFLLSSRSFIRTFDWRDQFTLYRHDVNVRGDSYNLQNGLASEYLDKGDFRNAKIHVLESIKLKKDFCYSWNNLGVIQLHEKSYEKARISFQTAIKNGGCYLAYQNMSTFLYFHDSFQNAETFDKKALKELPNNAKIWFMYSLTEAKLEKYDEAINAIKMSHKFSPSSGTVYVYQQLLNKKPIELKE